MAFRPPAREGISPRKVVLRGVVPDSPQYFAADAGDSPFPAGHVLPPGLVLERPIPAWFHPAIPHELTIPFDYTVLHQDEHLLVVDKPHFLPTTPNGRLVRETLQTRLRQDLGNDNIVALHRLDRLTAGVVLCSVCPETRGAYQRLFQSRAISKTYKALVEPAFNEELTVELFMAKQGRQVRVVDPATPGARYTHTYVKGNGVEVELHPRTGHTHQLRVVMNHLGSPIVGDDTYPEDQGLDLYDFSTPLQLLAYSVKFTDPLTGRAREFFSQRQLGSNL